MLGGREVDLGEVEKVGEVVGVSPAKEEEEGDDVASFRSCGELRTSHTARRSASAPPFLRRNPSIDAKTELV